MPTAAEGDSIGGYFRLILERYNLARQSLPFGGRHEIADYFDGLKRALEATQAVKGRPSLRVVASYGKGNWATIPWVSLLDSRETTSTQRGTYVVYLFREDGQGVYVKLAQGVTDTQKVHGAGAYKVLGERAAFLRREVTSLSEKGFDLSGKSDLGTTHQLAKMYEASTIAAKYYPVGSIPADEILVADLEAMLVAYEHLVTSGATLDSGATEPLALLGTWGAIKSDIDSVAEQIRAKGSWASPWSFRIKDEARKRLKLPFTLYINGGGGQIVARATVSDYACAEDASGMATPWPEITDPTWENVSRFGPGMHDAIKTWLKIESIELVNAFRATELTLASGLSTPSNMLNQNAFGYVVERVGATSYASEAPQSSKFEVAEPVLEVEPPDFTWLVEESLLPSSLLEKMVAALSGPSPQILLAGPPGTSKTWVAQRLALYMSGGRTGSVRTVQFHPSYTYESFMEGLRPKATPAGVSFALTPGVVLETVSAMAAAGHLNDPKHPYVLILDEANRANLPRVLGELLYLFEYRDQSIRLQYSSEFRLPTNLLFIGTMNTADRSIRSLDAALRRRFDVFELGPNADMLKAFLSQTGQDTMAIADGLSSLNAALANDIDRHHTVGHSFFMKKELTSDDLREIWERRIFPLIEEYFFDQPDLARDYTFQRFWPAT
jgi:5-methylcytosine-specific restriction protein B